MVSNLIDKLNYPDKVKTVFPEQYLAADIDVIAKKLSMAIPEVRKQLVEKGYLLCHSSFRNIGMKSAAEVVLETMPEALRTDQEEQKSEKIDTEAFLTALQAKNILSNAEKVRFQTLSRMLAVLYKMTQSYQYQYSLALGDKNELNSPTITINRKTLNQDTLEKALMLIIITILGKNAQGHWTAEYTYDLTRLSYKITESLFKSGELREQIIDFKAVWALSHHPEADKLVAFSQPA